MRTYELADPASVKIRSHPWTDSETNPLNRYRDFKENPVLVRESLEDFLPWASWPATETFYGLLEWLNGPDSLLESNDCAFTGPGENEDPGFGKSLQASGRVMILWRHLPTNLVRARLEWLARGIHERLSPLDPEFEWGALGTCVVPTRYVSLPGPPRQRLGFQLMLPFWAWGDSEGEVMANLDRTFRNLGESLCGLMTQGKADVRE
ncbi:MAG: hypothetical protein ABIT01_20225 [Thermoanaerobaculia bacterium]